MSIDLLIGAALAFVIALVTTPVGVSGAVFLIPVQLSVLHTPSPAITPTNLLYNLIAIPGAALRYGRQGSFWTPLTSALVLGTLPGVIAGAVIRVELLSGPEAFLLVVSAVLAPLGAWLLLFPPPAPRHAAPGIDTRITAMAAAVGVLGGIAGVITFAVLGLRGNGEIAPDWLLGVSIGLGGLGGSYLGARLQPHLPERALRRLLGLLAFALALRYLLQALL